MPHWQLYLECANGTQTPLAHDLSASGSWDWAISGRTSAGWYRLKVRERAPAPAPPTVLFAALSLHCLSLAVAPAVGLSCVRFQEDGREKERTEREKEQRICANGNAKKGGLGRRRKSAVGSVTF